MFSLSNMLRGSCRSFASVSRSPLIAPLQEAALEEKCILVNENDVQTGSATKRDCHRIQNDGSLLLHRAFSVFLFNTKGEMLVQKRSSEKITFPNHVTNACCSHPLSVAKEMNEEHATGVKLAAQRRLNYELGVPMDQTSLEDYHYLTRIHYKAADSNKIWGEHEIDYILFLQKDVDLEINEDEVSQVNYIAQKDFNDFLANLKDPITPWFSLIVKNHLHNWWENLHDLNNLKNHSKIFKFP